MGMYFENIEDNMENMGLTSPSERPDYTNFKNETGLGEDMKFLASMPELCDVTFLVGDTREPVCAVKAVLAARSKVFKKILYDTQSPQRPKKEQSQSSEKKITSFLKRSSEPLLSAPSTVIQKQGAQHRTILIEEFEPDVFRQLIEYVHTGCVTLQPRTLLGVLNAADYYGLDELRQACVSFLHNCVNVDTVCPLLSTADRYVQYKCTKSMLQRVLTYVDEHGNEVLNLGSFTLIPKHVVTLILSREELRADEFTKFQAALMWTKKHCDNNNIDWKPVFQESFVPLIQYHKIPANILTNEIVPLKVVPDDIIITALAYQADPSSVELPPAVRNSAPNRSMSCQSSSQKSGSSVTISSTGSDRGSLDGRRQS
ncbi:serine-enriched protein-like isoform X2 [Planococcus citri]|uniref:serine-enriched protein-like isoform X2 n=1 Tax=Planococcus citri TaxID=170843 RepID=UPI0031F9D774